MTGKYWASRIIPRVAGLRVFLLARIANANLKQLKTIRML